MSGPEWVGYLVGSNVAGIVAVIVLLSLREKVGSLDKTVATQAASLQAVSEVNRSLQGFVQVLDKLDLPKWAERYEAHAKITEQEAAAKIAAVERQAGENIAQFRGQVATEMSRGWRKAMDGLFDEHAEVLRAVIALLPFAPGDVRKKVVEEAKIRDRTKDLLRLAATSTPEPEPTLSQILAAMPASPGERLKERMMMPLFSEHPSLQIEHPPAAGGEFGHSRR